MVRLLDDVGGAGRDAYVRELGWREFAHHLLHHFPRRYVKTGELTRVDELQDGQMLTVVGQIADSRLNSYQDRRTGRPAYRLDVRVKTDGPSFRISFFAKNKGMGEWQQNRMPVGRVERAGAWSKRETIEQSMNIKHVLGVCAVAAGLSGVWSGFAAEGDKPQPPRGPRERARAEQVKERVERIAKELELSEDQKGKIRTVLQGQVDKETQRVAFRIGDSDDFVAETGLYDLTKDECPVLVHFGPDKTEQYLLVRLDNPEAEAAMRGFAEKAGLKY